MQTPPISLDRNYNGKTQQMSIPCKIHINFKQFYNIIMYFL